MPGVVQLFAVVALSFACVLHFIMSSCALHHHVFETCIRPGLLVLFVVRSEPDTLAGARGMSEIVFYKCLENVPGMG